MKSIIQKGKQCYECNRVTNLNNHHIFFGRNRKNSEKYGLKVWLCYEHHESENGVHGRNGHSLDIKLKKIGQQVFEQLHSRREFVDIFKRNYL